MILNTAASLIYYLVDLRTHPSFNLCNHMKHNIFEKYSKVSTVVMKKLQSSLYSYKLKGTFLSKWLKMSKI